MLIITRGGLFENHHFSFGGIIPSRQVIEVDTACRLLTDLVSAIWTACHTPDIIRMPFKGRYELGSRYPRR